MGVVLRLFYVTPIPLNYQFILHAHSHTAMLGWIYLGLTTLIYKLFLSKTDKGKQYKRIFMFTNACVLGMLIAFPFQGYALSSIIFSSLFLVATYWFSWFAIHAVPQHFKNRFSWKLVKTSLWYLVFSSIGPWAVGAVISTLGKTSIWYKIVIYFYLHFQYNAWFILALLGFLFFIIEKGQIHINPKQFRTLFVFMNIGLILSFFLSVLGYQPPDFIYWLAAVGAICQGIAFYLLFKLLKPIWEHIKSKIGPLVGFLLKISGILLLLKVALQFLSAIPYFAELAFAIPDFIIGYLHVVFLGIVSVSLFAFLIHFKLLRPLSKGFMILYTIAFISTECLIFYKGFIAWLGFPFFSTFFWLLAGLSVLFPVAIGILFFRNIASPRK